MISWKRTAVAAVVVVGLVTGCSSSGGGGRNAASTSPTPSNTVAAPFDATVSLSDFSATCREVACWLPTQWEPKLVKGETVSLRDKWPMDGMPVRVVCETTGETYRDQTGQDTDAWYGILVPSDKLQPLRHCRKAMAMLATLVPPGSRVGPASGHLLVRIRLSARPVTRLYGVTGRASPL